MMGKWAAYLAIGCLAPAFLAGPAAADSAAEPVIPVQLVAVQYTTLSAEMAGKIERITVKEGERFKDGQPLVSFDCVILRAQQEEAQAILGAAEKSKAAHKRLLELNSAGTLETDKSVADAAVAQAKLNSAHAMVSKCGIFAPFSGRVVEQKARAHQYVQAGQPVLDILDDSALDAEFIVPSGWVRAIKPGMPIQVTVDETRRTYTAKVSRIGAKVDAVSHSVKVVAEIRGDFPELIAGMTGRVQMPNPTP